jgi:hypothetical protein
MGRGSSTMALLDSMTTYATSDSSQTIFERVYTVKPSFDDIHLVRWVRCIGPRNATSPMTTSARLMYLSVFDIST